MEIYYNEEVKLLGIEKIVESYTIESTPKRQ